MSNRKDKSHSDIVRHMQEMRQTHIEWAEHFERHPEIEAKYMETGEWDSAKEHRRLAAIYDKVIEALRR